MKRWLLTVALATVWIVASITPASAHRLTVDPPGQTDPTVDSAVSQAYAQAHCHAAAPETATASSGDVVVFTPAAELPCPPVLNPGGQTTGP
jgi:hypothetical protein